MRASAFVENSTVAVLWKLKSMVVDIALKWVLWDLGRDDETLGSQSSSGDTYKPETKRANYNN